jgi:ABC-type spermidine/putrescine transport system permease subunit I
LNNLPIFTPTRWRRRELVSRVCAIGVITIFLAIRLFRWEQYPQDYETVHHFYLSLRSATGDALYTETYIRSLWGLRVAVWGTETAILLGYISAYFTRARAVSVARGFMETLFPLFIAGLPILISFAPYNLPQRVPLTSHLFFPKIVRRH